MRKVTIAIILISLAVASFLSVYLGGFNTYDLQGLAVGILRLNVLLIWVLFFMRLKAAVEGDDLDEDWKRIDDGNLATAIYRSAEFASLVIAGAVLLAKI